MTRRDDADRIERLEHDLTRERERAEEWRKHAYNLEDVLRFVLEHHARKLWDSYFINRFDPNFLYYGFNRLLTDYKVYREYTDIEAVKTRLGL